MLFRSLYTPILAHINNIKKISNNNRLIKPNEMLALGQMHLRAHGLGNVHTGIQTCVCLCVFILSSDGFSMVRFCILSFFKDMDSL